MKHTPGPWVVNTLKSGASAWIQTNKINPHPTDVACCDDGYISNEQNIANAHLIAAAPDLLEACKLALNYLQRNDVYRDGESYPALVKAIAKAEGNS